MRQTLKDIKRKLKPSYSCLSGLVSSYAPRQEISAFKGWLRKYPGYVAALVLIVLAVWSTWKFLMVPEIKRVEYLRLQVRANSPLYEKKLEQKNQRLSAALSHLEANPQIETPDNHQSLIGPYAKMGWTYGTTENGLDQSSHKHAIVEIRNAMTPLKSERVKVTGEVAWYPLTLSKKVNEPGTFLWRVIEGEMDSSGQLRAKGSWGPYSVFTIYPSVTKRIEVTKKIRIGSYNVGQVELEGKSSTSKDSTTKNAREGLSCVEPSDGLSDDDTTVLCSVIDQMFKKDKYGTIDPVMARYSNIDDKLLDALKTGELDIALGNISSARYRRDKGFNFVEYAEPKPVLVTNDQKKSKADKIGAKDKICVVRGTVYKHVLEELIKTNQGRYNLAVCQNTFDAVDQLLKNDIQWFLMMGEQSWKDIEKPGLHRNETEIGLLASVPKNNEMEGDAFAMSDDSIYEEMCRVMKEMKGKLINNKVILEHVECRPRSR